MLGEINIITSSGFGNLEWGIVVGTNGFHTALEDEMGKINRMRETIYARDEISQPQPPEGWLVAGMSKKKLVVLIILPLALLLVSLFLGRYHVSPMTVMQVMASRVLPIEPTWSPTVETVIFQVRLPRVILAMFVGAGLSISGASFQGLFQNPLVSPGILGVAVAAGVLAALAILFSGNSAVI
ncbi:MAG: iron chelate uptake ABC transporter family permease subunit, partial [Dehalococcoidales bacterium]|nr:iron chelate uptake ABC transporter family permease subunit [Dehalococcoidales bacterium]